MRQQSIYTAYSDNIAQANRGNAEAQNYVGLAYSAGKEVPQDEYKAFEWYKKAADQGNMAALYNLGGQYKRGRGTARDYDKALDCFRRAASMGCKDSKVEIEHTTKMRDEEEREKQRRLGMFSAPPPPPAAPLYLINKIAVIDYKSLAITPNPLGEGSFGIVYHAKFQHQDVAVKKLKLQVLDEKTKKEFISEAEIMDGLRSEHVIGLRGVCIEPYCLVMEYAAHGSLDKYLQNNQNLEWPKRYQIAIKIGEGLSFLHKQKPIILHRDLKSMNVLLDANYSPKLTDFGLAKLKLESTSKMSVGAVGTPAWMAPELFSDDPKHTITADIYSFAVILWEIASCKIPFANLNAMQIMFAVANKKRPDFAENSCSSAYRDIVVNAWIQEAERRTPLDKIVSDLKKLQAGNEDIPQSITTNSTPSASSSIGLAGAASLI